MGSIGIQAAGAALTLPSPAENTGNSTGVRRILRADEYLVATLLPVPAANTGGGLDIRA